MGSKVGKHLFINFKTCYFRKKLCSRDHFCKWSVVLGLYEDKGLLTQLSSEWFVKDCGSYLFPSTLFIIAVITAAAAAVTELVFFLFVLPHRHAVAFHLFLSISCSMSCRMLGMVSMSAMSCTGRMADRLMSFLGVCLLALLSVMFTVKHFVCHFFHFVSKRVVLIICLLDCRGASLVGPSFLASRSAGLVANSLLTNRSVGLVASSLLASWSASLVAHGGGLNMINVLLSGLVALNWCHEWLNWN